jgi:hypothetical protein
MYFNENAQKVACQVAFSEPAARTAILVPGWHVECPRLETLTVAAAKGHRGAFWSRPSGAIRDRQEPFVGNTSLGTSPIGARVALAGMWTRATPVRRMAGRWCRRGAGLGADEVRLARVSGGSAPPPSGTLRSTARSKNAIMRVLPAVIGQAGASRPIVSYKGRRSCVVPC